MPVEVTVAESFFRSIRKLQRRYPHVFDDVGTLKERLEAGEVPGDQIQGVRHTVYKVRIRNSDAQRGKSGGYRVVYYLQTAERVTLLTIYSKSDQADIPVDLVQRLVEEYLSDLTSNR